MPPTDPNKDWHTPPRPPEAAPHRQRRREELGLLGAYTFGLAHSLRNPLTGIQGKAELLARKHPELAAELKGIATECTRMDDQLAVLISKFQDEMSAEPAYVDLNSLIEKEIAYFSFDATFKHKTTKHVLLDPCLPKILGYYADFAEVIDAIIQNALRSMEGAPNRELRITTRIADGRVILNVDHSGRGSRPADLDPVFRPKSSSAPCNVGTGTKEVPAWPAAAEAILAPYGATLDLETDGAGFTHLTVRIPQRATVEPRPPVALLNV